MAEFMRFDRWGNQLGVLDALSAVHTEGLDGTDQVVVTTVCDVAKGERIVWADQAGRWREHMADSVTRTHDVSGTTATVTYVSSLGELWDDYVVEKQPSGTAAAALKSILDGTRWGVGSVTVGGSKSHKFYHVSVREALQELLDVWGGEMASEITVSGGSVATRAVSIVPERGDPASAKRFTWTKDIESITRAVVSDSPKTRIYGYGKGVETESGGFGRRLTFGSVNGGKDYVEDAAATQVWGHPGPTGAPAPAVGTYVNEQCEDAAQLLEETKAYLERAKDPTVSYTANVVDLASHGREWEGVALGDRVAIIDREFCEGGIRLTGRVAQIERDLLDGSTVVTFGNVSEAMTDMFASFAQALQGAQSQRAAMDAVAGTSATWLLQLQKALNEQFDQAGSYQVSSFELGSIWSNVPLDPDTGKPKSRAESMWAININGAGFRIADGLRADGSWDWRTFGTGSGFTADCLNVGTIRGGSNTWNLSTGDLSFSQGSIVIDGPSGTQVRIDAANGLRITQNGRLVGGLEVVDGQAHLRAARAGTSATNYVTTGTVVGGNSGASFVNQYGNYLDIEALKAEDDSSGKTTGVGMAVFDRPIVHASTYYDHLWLHRPGTVNTYLEQPPEQLYLSRNKVHLQYSDTCGAFVSPTSMSFRWSDAAGLFMGGDMFSFIRNKNSQGLYMQDDLISFRWGTGGLWVTNSSAMLKFNDSTYIDLTPSALTVRHGDTGFRHSGNTWQELTW